MCQSIELLEGDSGLEEGVSLGEGLELVVRGHGEAVGVSFALPAPGVGEGFGEQAGAMVVVVGVGVEPVEVVEGLGPTRGDVGVAEELADHVSVLAFHQGVIIAPAGTGLGELDAELLQQLGYPLVDVFRAVVGVEVVEGERKLSTSCSKAGTR